MTSNPLHQTCPTCGAIIQDPSTTAPEPSADDLLQTRLDYWDWGSTRILDTFRYENIITVADLVECTEGELFRNPGFGQRRRS
jgi:hypothetical protein